MRVARFWSALLAVCVVGCSSAEPSGPKSAIATSTEIARLEERIAFIEQYVTFDRRYDALEYDLAYQNNGGGFVPGPSDWDIRLLAVVPEDEVEEWIPVGGWSRVRQPSDWVLTLPGEIATRDITEWYELAGVEIGVDRARSIVAYRRRSRSRRDD